MPTFDHDKAPQWRSWQPDNLLHNDVEAVTLPTLDAGVTEEQMKVELARLRKQAEQQGYSQGLSQGEEEGRKQGFAAGVNEGREAGLAQGLADAQAQQQQLLRQAEQWISNFKLALESLDSLIPARLVQLSLTAVQQLYGSVQNTDNQALIKQIRNLMKHDALLHGSMKLYVHPDDRAQIAEVLGDTLAQVGWTLHSDAQLAAGGCRIISPDVEFDVTLETRWQALCQLAREELSQ